MKEFATISDVEELWRQLTPAEMERAEKLLPIICDGIGLSVPQLAHIIALKKCFVNTFFAIFVVS